MSCVNDTVTPKGVLINLNSGSDYTNCSVFTGTSENSITGTTSFTSVTGGTINITGIDPTLMEIFVKMVCIGCCEQIFRVNLDDCCNYVPVSTNTPTPTLTSTPTNTPTTSSSAICECNTYRITFNANCGEYLTWTDCDTNTTMNEQGLYFGLPGVTFTTGSVIELCSCSTPTAGCPSEDYDVMLISSGCSPQTTYTPTPTVEMVLTATPTPTITATSTPTLTSTSTPTPTCSYKQWTVGVCTIGVCQGGICTCQGSTVQTVYTTCDVTDLLDESTAIYEGPSFTKPFTADFTYQPGTNQYIYNSSGSGVTIVCPLGDGC